MQKITLVGFMGRDAAIRETKNGNKFVSLTVGVNGKVNGTDKSSWYDIIWFNYSENMVQYLKKGSSVIVIGELDADIEIGSDNKPRCRRSVVADSVAFNSTGNKQQNTDNDDQAPAPKTNNKKNTPEPPSDEEISITVKPTTEKVKGNPISPINPEENDLPF